MEIGLTRLYPLPLLQHQIGNFLSEINSNQASLSCYGTATHFLENENGNVWTVIGSYDFNLEKISDQWKVSAMKFNFKYQDGNLKLIEAALKKAQAK